MRIKDILPQNILRQLRDTILLRIIRRQLLNTYSKDKVGKLGEKLALIYLRKKGYRLLASNLKTPIGELDLIFLSPNNDQVVVVEVRVAKEISSAFSKKKEEKVKKLTYWLKEFILKRDINLRIDLILIDSSTAKIEHILDVIDY